MKFGVVCRPMPGKEANGDAYLIKEWEQNTLMAVVDGIGHGEEASVASRKAVEYIEKNATEDIEEIIRGCHHHLKGTRGAALGIVKIDKERSLLSYTGAGNIEVRVISDSNIRPFSMNGMVGVILRKTKKFEYPYTPRSIIMLHSDGVHTHFDLSDYPLLHENPQYVAEQIIEKCGKKYDDATVLIALETPKKHLSP